MATRAADFLQQLQMQCTVNILNNKDFSREQKMSPIHIEKVMRASKTFVQMQTSQNNTWIQ